MHPYIALVPGHGARVRDGRAVHDPGASALVRDSEGRAETLIEEDRVRMLAPRLAARLAAAGFACGIHDAAGPSPGTDPGRSYRQRCAAGARAATAKGCGSMLVMHLHINAGGGRYCAAIHHPGEPSTPLWAAAIETQLATLPGVVRRREQSTVASFPRADGLIKAAWGAGSPSLRVHAIVLEPLFIDTPDHWRHLSDGGLDLVADRIAAGLVAGMEA